MIHWQSQYWSVNCDAGGIAQVPRNGDRVEKRNETCWEVWEEQAVPFFLNGVEEDVGIAGESQ